MLIQKFPDKTEFNDLVRDYNVIPVCVEILADTETPVSLLKKLGNDRDAVFLLESVEGGERWGRYSFLGLSAHSHIRVFKDSVEIKSRNETRRILHDSDPLRILRDFMSRYKAPSMPLLPRFWGGMVGYLTYEMVSFFEAIPSNLPENSPIAHFIVPDELIIFDNIRHTLFALVISFPETGDDPGRIYRTAGNRLNTLVRKMNTPIIEESAGPVAPDYDLKPAGDPENYRGRVSKTKEYILEGEIIQAVISQPFVCAPAPDLWSLYRAQRFVNPSPYMFYFKLGKTALIGSSPETMVRLENGVASLRPIAGTRPRGGTEQADRALADELLQDEKERAEHVMLVDLGRNDLGRVSEIGSVQVTDLMVVERYSHVMHLVSNIQSDLKPEYDAWELLRATFPAGTLSGAPKVRAMEIIAELERNPRGPYGGSVGYVSFQGNMDMAITIRTACVEDEQLVVRAGAGIVADSDPEQERKETESKAMAIRKALQLVEGRFDEGGRIK